MQYHDSKVDSANAIDQAWKEGRYGDVLSDLQRDWIYPDGFQIDKLGEDSEDQKLLKQFVKARTNLHEEIKQGNLDIVQELTSRKESQFYLNSENRSAAFTAIKSKQFRIYAFLKSIGVKLIVLDDEEKPVSYSKRFRRSEKYVLDELSLEEKNNLREIMRLYIPSDPLEQLMSKSKSPQSNYRTKVKNYYKTIHEKVPEILEIVQYEKDLEVIFDFDSSDVKDMAPLVRKQAGGLTLPKEKTIYVACKREERKILGTLVHELTHVAMEMIFKNNCKPYTDTDKCCRNEFEETVNRTELIAKDLKGLEGQIISNVFSCYSPEKYHKELIVRVPQILMESGNGITWLEENAKELLEFFLLRILPKLEEFVNESHLLKPRSLIRSLNENIGQINDIKRCLLFFQNLEALEAFLKRQKISFLIAKNTKLSVCRVLQALYRKNYVDSYGNFIVLKFETCINEFDDIKMAFSSEATDSLILDCQSADHTSLKKGIIQIIQQLSTTKNIIFVLEKNQAEKIKKIISEMDKFDDQDFCLNDLDELSREQLMKKHIFFQGSEINLATFCEEEEFRKLIDAEIMAELCENKKYQIGNKVFGISDLDGSYAEIFLPVNKASLINELYTTNDIFTFIGEIDQISKYLNSSEISYQIGFKTDFSDNNKIFLIEKNSENLFREFCHKYPEKKVHQIAMNADESCTLERIYNPDFYMPRKIEKNVIILNNMSNLKNHLYGTLIVNGENLPESIPYDKKLDTNEAKAFLEKSDTPTYWFRQEYNVLIFENSSNVEDNEFQKLLSMSNRITLLTDENNLVKEIVDKKVLIIADEPGMGKSTTVTKLYESDTFIKNHWIVRINFTDYIDVIKSIKSSNITISTVIHFLEKVESISRNRLSKIIFELIFYKENKFSKFSMLMVFDGFDELLDVSDRNKIIQILKVLKNKTKCKIWITTRPHYKSLLEDKLQTSALQIHPINDTSKRRFIEKYYIDRLNLILTKEKFDTKLSVYVEEFINKMESVFKGNISKILGTPLQLSLMMYDSIEHFRNWMENENAVLNFSYLGNNILEIYEHYIDRRYRIYFKKTLTDQKLHQKLIKERLEQCHEEIAIHVKKLDKCVKKYKALILLLGLVQMHNRDLQFFHFTFNEYYIATHFVKILKNRKSSDYMFTENIKFYLSDVLSTWGNNLIQKFIDLDLEKRDFNKIPRRNLRLFTETFFLLCKKCSSERENTDFTEVSEPEASLHFAIWENNENLFNFIFSTLILYCRPWNYVDIMLFRWKDGNFETANFTLLHCAIGSIVNENSKIWNILLETMDKMSLEDQKKIITAKAKENYSLLHYAVGYCNLFAIRIILEKAKLLLTGEELLLFFTNIRFSNMPHRVFSHDHPNYSQTINMFFRESEKALPANHHREFLIAIYRDNCFYYREEHFVYKLFQEKEKAFKPIEFFELFARKFEEGSYSNPGEDIKLIHVIAFRNHYKVLELLYEKYKIEKSKLPDQLNLYNILMLKEYPRNKTVLRTALERCHVEFTNLLLKIAKEEFLPDQQLNFIMSASTSASRQDSKIIQKHINYQLRHFIDELRLNVNDFIDEFEQDNTILFENQK